MPTAETWIPSLLSSSVFAHLPGPAIVYIAAQTIARIGGAALTGLGAGLAADGR